MNLGTLPIDLGALRATIRKEIEDSAVALRVRQLQSRKRAVGTTTVTWTGGNDDSSVATVTHGLGRTPVSVVTCDAGGDRWCVVENGAWDDDSFTVQASARTKGVDTGAGGSQTIAWMAEA